jgi:hypothetical protein
MALQAGFLWKTPMFSIDPTTTLTMRGLEPLEARAEDLLPAVCRRLEVDFQG